MEIVDGENSQIDRIGRFGGRAGGGAEQGQQHGNDGQDGSWLLDKSWLDKSWHRRQHFPGRAVLCFLRRKRYRWWTANRTLHERR